MRFNTRLAVVLATASGMLLAPGLVRADLGAVGDLYVANNGPNTVTQYDGATGEFVGVFASDAGNAYGLTFIPGGNLFVASVSSGGVLQYDGETGEPLGVFASGIAGPGFPIFGPNGNLFVTSRNNHSVMEFDGATGNFIGDFATDANWPQGLVFGGPDGNLYVGSAWGDAIKEYDGTTGAFIQEFLGPSSTARSVSNSAQTATCSSRANTNSVVELDVTTGEMNLFATGELSYPYGLTFGPNGNLFVSGNASNNVVEFDGETGALIGSFAGEGLGEPIGLQFKPVPEPAALMLLGLGAVVVPLAFRRRTSK